MHSGFAYRIGVNCIVVSLLLGNSQDLQYGYNEYMRFALSLFNNPFKTAKGINCLKLLDNMSKILLHNYYSA